MNDNHQRFCVFQSSPNAFAIAATSVQSVITTPELTCVPHSDPILNGLCHLQNEFIPVFGLRALTQVQYEQNNQLENQMMVMVGSKGHWGLLIDQAIGLAHLEVSFQSFSDDQDAFSRVVLGTASYKSQVLQVLDPDALYEYTYHLFSRFWQQDLTPIF